jgi:N-acetylglucosaminyldiphosphoundecaprenol N-acetyl-beta-D-mannosaminyltransferase
MNTTMMAPTSPVAPTRTRVALGRLWADAMTREEALAEVEALVRGGQGGRIYTPNLNHLVLAEHNAAFRQAYANASLSFADGTPLLWAARLLGTPLPAKLSGSDLVLPMAQLAARQGWRVYLLGGSPGVARDAAARLERDCRVEIAGIDDAPVSATNPSADGPVVERLQRAEPHLVFVALGAPKQELFIDRIAPMLGGAVAMGVGGTLDFIAGRVRRAPEWVSSVGLEWAYRVSQEPGRLWRRYLLHDPEALAILARSALVPAASRVVRVPRLVEG